MGVDVLPLGKNKKYTSSSGKKNIFNHLFTVYFVDFFFFLPNWRWFVTISVLWWFMEWFGLVAYFYRVKL